MIEIREEERKDHDSVRIVNDLAFRQSDEGRIVDKLRKACQGIISLVAVSGEKIVGHIFFSPVVIRHNDTDIIGMGLAPMAVLMVGVSGVAKYRSEFDEAM